MKNKTQYRVLPNYKNKWNSYNYNIKIFKNKTNYTINNCKSKSKNITC